MKKSIAVSRGVVVLDYNVKQLETLLSDRNIIVIVLEKNCSWEQIRRYVAQRLFITRNSKRFLYDIPSFECGLIAVENVDKDIDELAKNISRLISKLRLCAIRHGFLLKLNKNGKYTFKDMTE
ncbi:MAG: hypothetical protein EHM45_11910 [Desulfobacteraceae bacterium]|nr:MAG: hypothetical protein EHM45_11910 [Desulfobacteraceae bacterium]